MFITKVSQQYDVRTCLLKGSFLISSRHLYSTITAIETNQSETGRFMKSFFLNWVLNSDIIGMTSFFLRNQLPPTVLDA